MLILQQSRDSALWELEEDRLQSEISTLESDYVSLNSSYCKLRDNFTQLIENAKLRFMEMLSGSMHPAIEIGDYLVYQEGCQVADLVAGYETGDIIVFRKPGTSDELIVHRAVEAHSAGDDLYVLTKGDNNIGVDPWRIYDDHLVGKLIAVIPSS